MSVHFCALLRAKQRTTWKFLNKKARPKLINNIDFDSRQNKLEIRHKDQLLVAVNQTVKNRWKIDSDLDSNNKQSISWNANGFKGLSDCIDPVEIKAQVEEVSGCWDHKQWLDLQSLANAELLWKNSFIFSNWRFTEYRSLLKLIRLDRSRISG